MSLTNTPAPAQEAVLTDEEILHRWDIYVSEPCAAYPLTDSDKLDFARAIESALLPKLCATVADHCAGPNCTALDDDTGPPHSPECRAALASAPVAEDSVSFEEWFNREYREAIARTDDLVSLFEERRTLRKGWDARAALASAPVAGEAVNLQAAREYLDQWGCLADSNVRALLENAERAAPQASEAVRDAALEEAARQCEDIYSWPGAYSAGIMNLTTLTACASAIRALKSQSAALSAQPSGNPGELSAQPGAQKGGSDGR